MSLHWSAGYLGLPFLLGGRDRVGIDCYGLARLVLRERAGISLDAATEAAAVARPDQVAAEADRIAAGSPWHPVSGDVRELDVAVFSTGVYTRHIGIMVGREMMLHVVEGAPSCLTRLDAPRWAHRRRGILRHQDLA